MRPSVTAFSVSALFFLAFGVGCGLPPSSDRSASSVDELRGDARQRAVSDSESGADVFGSPDTVLARIDGYELTRREFVARVLGKLGKNRLLADIVKYELFRQEAARRGIEVDDAEVEKLVDEEIDVSAKALAGGNAAQGRERLAELYHLEGLTLEDVRSDLRPGLRARLLAERVTRAMRRVDDATLRDFWEQNRQFHVRHVYYTFPPFTSDPTDEQARRKDAARRKAESAVKRLRASEIEFARLAREESEDHLTRYRGGVLGPMSARVGFDPAIRNAIFQLRAGEVSDPVENPVGAYHVFEVTRIVPAGSFESNRDQLRDAYQRRPPDGREIRSAFETLRDRARLEWLPDRAAEPTGGRAAAEAES